MQHQFDKGIGLDEQITKVLDHKQPGRKHQHRIGPGKAAQRAANRRKNVAAYNNHGLKLRKARIRDYWRGLISEFPE